MIATLTGQGMHTQVPRHTAFTCLRESRTGRSRAASGSVTPSRTPPVVRRTTVPKAAAWGRRVGVLAQGESRWPDPGWTYVERDPPNVLCGMGVPTQLNITDRWQHLSGALRAA